MKKKVNRRIIVKPCESVREREREREIKRKIGRVRAK